MPQIFLVDDEPSFLESASLVLKSAGFTDILPCPDPFQVLHLLRQQPVELMVLDLNMPGMHGVDLLEQVAPEFPDLPVIVLTGTNEIKMAVACIKKGAFDYRVKPIEEEEFVAAVRHGLEVSALRRENLSLKENFLSSRLQCPDNFREMVTASPEMINIFHYVEAIAASAQPVLITGETGTGKELIARAIHANSGRSGAFVPLNLAGVDDNFFSDTLFGHTRGAFTGADKPRPGLIDQARDGTLFLDEIGDLEAASQVKLLRLLQEREYLPLGSDLSKRSDARVVVATNADLHSRQEAGHFRKDLYFRLHTHQIHLPPLRERSGDIPLLLDHFLAASATLQGRRKPAAPPELIKLLKTYHFPGNVREFQSLVFDAVSRHKSGILSMEHFKAYIKKHSAEGAGKAPPPAKPFAAEPGRLPTLKMAAEFLVAEALRRADGNQAIAAQMLGITRQALNKRLHQSKP